MAERLTALELMARVVNPNSFTRWDGPPLPPFALGGEPTQEYLDELAGAREKTGLDESVITGEAMLGGRRIALVMCEFGFLAGSIGVAAAERLTQGIERATAEGLPLIAVPVSGGTRMQEGAVAFIQMVKITAAVVAHKNAQLPYVVYLRNPTTGGVLASWASLGHVTAAEPGALIGFLGPRVYKALYNEDFPPNVQTAENLAARGLVNAVVPPEHLRAIAINALTVLASRADPPLSVPDLPAEVVPDIPAWESIERSRKPARPGVRSLLRLAANSVTPLQGTGEGERDRGMLLALARFGTASAIVLGQDRKYAELPLGPAGLREARRGIRLAAELGIALVTVIDTAGAALSREAEEGGLAGEIARCLADLTALRAPTVSVILGQGSGGAALALLPADRVIASSNAWLSPLPPEGAAAIVHRDVSRAPEMAAAQGVRAFDLLRTGIVDRIVVERPDAADEPVNFLGRMGAVLEYELASLYRRPLDEVLDARLRRFRGLGNYS